MEASVIAHMTRLKFRPLHNSVPSSWPSECRPQGKLGPLGLFPPLTFGDNTPITPTSAPLVASVLDGSPTYSTLGSELEAWEGELQGARQD